MRKGYVAYIRVANADDMAVENQKQYIENYAKQKNIKIDDYYIDNGYSGTNLDRPQLKQMLREVRSRNITKGIIVKDISRLSREQTGVMEILNKISRRKISLISTVEEETLTNNIMISIIQWERENQLDRKKQGQKILEQRGACVYIPYKRGTVDDMEYKKQKREELKKEGIHHITFKYKDDIKRKVGTRDERN